MHDESGRELCAHAARCPLRKQGDEYQTLTNSSASVHMRLNERSPSAEPNRKARRLPGVDSHVAAVAIASDGGLLASGSNDGSVRLWDVGSGELVRTLR